MTLYIHLSRRINEVSSRARGVFSSGEVSAVEVRCRWKGFLTGVIQYGSEADDFEFEDVGSAITVSPSNSTSCDQRVNQAASAFCR
jgi:hypothetical protein